MIALAPGEVHVWYAEDGPADAAATASYLALLAPSEVEQMGRFYFEHDRRRYLHTRALVRTVLSRYEAIAPEHWQFERNHYGRPSIAACHGRACRLSFNLSHCRGLVTLAVARDMTLGIDVEDVVGREAPLDIADRFFSPEEAASLAALPAEGRQLRFFEYWTLKESYIKARGMGLSIDLDAFTFRLPPGGIEFAPDARLGDTAERWRFLQWQPPSGHLIALCLEAPSEPSFEPTVRRGLPCVPGEPAHVPAFSRRSG